MSYIEKGKSIKKEVIKAALLKMLNNGYHKSTLRKMKDNSNSYGLGDLEHQADYAAGELYNLNEAMRAGRHVFAICEKEPRNLDSGRHYFSIRYVMNNKVCILCLQYFTEVLGGDTMTDRSQRKWLYGSGAIGMSRLLDATNGVFTFLKELGGCYSQIDTI